MRSILTDDARAAERRRRVSLGIRSSILTRGTGFLINIISLPLTLKYLGAERYGAWTAIFTTVSWIAVLDLGIADNLTNRVSVAYAVGDSVSARASVTNALFLSLILAIVLMSGLVICWRFIPFFEILPRTDHATLGEAVLTAGVACTIIVLGLVSNLFGKILAGYQELVVFNLWSLAASGLGLCGLGAGIAFHVSMPLLLGLTLGMPTWCGIIGLVWLVNFDKPELRPAFSLISLCETRGLFGGGLGFFISHVAVVIGFGTDNLVIGHYLGLSEVTPYAVSWRLAAYAGIFQSLVFPSLWPAYAEAHARNDLAWLQDTFRKAMRGTLFISCSMFAVLALAGQQIILWWAGPIAVPNLPLLLCIGAWNIVASVMAVQSNFLGAIGKNKALGWLSLVASIANVGASIYLVQLLGSIGAVLGTAAAYLILLIAPQTTIVATTFSNANTRSTG